MWAIRQVFRASTKPLFEWTEQVNGTHFMYIIFLGIIFILVQIRNQKMNYVTDICHQSQMIKNKQKNFIQKNLQNLNYSKIKIAFIENCFSRYFDLDLSPLRVDLKLDYNFGLKLSRLLYFIGVQTGALGQVYNVQLPYRQMLGFDLALTTKYKHYEQDFIDLGRIGAGGFAHVQKVKSKLDHRQYALKVLEIKPSLCKEDIIETIHKFLEQVKVLSYLNHNNVIQYHGCWVEDQQNNMQQVIQVHHEQQVEDSNEIVMVMEQDFSSGEIEFAYSGSNSAAKTNLNNRNSQVFQNQKPKLQIPVDNSQASAKIRLAYKTIKIFILSQLCEGNVQTYLYQRNLGRKNQKPVKSPKKAHHLGTPSKSLQVRQKKDELMQSYKMIIQIIEGLEYLHSKKIIHRDIKLHNIVFDKNKKCKIIDFGLAKKARMLQSIGQYPNDMSAHNEQLEQLFSSSVGTRIYSSPQQISSQRYDHRTDIFSLAIVILMFFCDFTTTHEQLQIIQKIRKNDLQFIRCDQRLKSILSKCLGQERNRPRLVQVRKVVKLLLRQRYQRQSKKLPQNSLPQNLNAMEKEENIYIVENSKLKKKLSKGDFLSLNTSLKDKQTSSSQNTVNQEQIFDFNIDELDFDIKA